MALSQSVVNRGIIDAGHFRLTILDAIHSICTTGAMIHPVFNERFIANALIEMVSMSALPCWQQFSRRATAYYRSLADLSIHYALDARN
jgi:hypothetical protein